MHILEIPSFFTPYGGEFCLEQAKALQFQGDEVRILSNVQISIKKNFRQFLTLPFNRWTEEIDGISLYRSYQRGIPKVIYPNVRRWLSIVLSMFDNYVDKCGKPDIIHAHCCKWAGYAAMLIHERYAIPYVITEHLPKMNYDIEFKGYQKVWQIPLLKKAYETADHVITVSDEWVDDLSCYFGKEYRHTTLPNIIDTHFFAYCDRQPLSERNFRYCCLANNESRKGYDILIPAFRQMRNHRIELHIAGKNTDSLRRMVQASALDAKIIIHGELDKKDVRTLLYQCDALVLSSSSEVQPLSIMEALSTGIPYISTEAVPHNLRFADSCIIVPIDDIASLSSAMDQMIERYPEIDKYHLSNLAYHTFSPSIIGKQLHELFQFYVNISK